MSDIESNKRLVRQYLSLLGAGKVDAIQALQADDFQWTIPQDPRYSQLSGTFDKQRWETLYRGFLTNAPGGLEYRVVGMTAEEDRVACEAESFAQTSRGPFNNRYHFLFTVRDGKISSGKEYADSLYMYKFIHGNAS